MLGSGRRGWIGVDVGTRCVKLAQVRRADGRCELLDAAIVPRDEAWPGGDLSQRPPRASEGEIRAGIEAANLSGRGSACSAPMALCDVRGLRVEETDEAAQRLAVCGALESLGVVKQESHVVDFWPTDVGAGRSDSTADNLTAVALRRDWSVQISRDVARAGLACHAIDAIPPALARAVALTHDGPIKETLAAIDWGHASVTFCIVRAGQPLFVRSLLKSGLGCFLATLRDTLELNEDEALCVLRQTGVRGTTGAETEDEMRQVIEEVLSEPLSMLLSELRRTLGYLQSHRADLQPSRIWLFGGGATIRNIDGFLSQHLGLRTARWRMKSRNSKSRFDDSFSMLGPAIALSSLAWSDT